MMGEWAHPAPDGNASPQAVASGWRRPHSKLDRLTLDRDGRRHPRRRLPASPPPVRSTVWPASMATVRAPCSPASQACSRRIQVASASMARTGQSGADGEDRFAADCGDSPGSRSRGPDPRHAPMGKPRAGSRDPPPLRHDADGCGGRRWPRPAPISSSAFASARRSVRAARHQRYRAAIASGLPSRAP